MARANFHGRTQSFKNPETHFVRRTLLEFLSIQGREFIGIGSAHELFNLSVRLTNAWRF